jgi:hypothetical protein
MPWIFVLNDPEAARWVIAEGRMAFKEGVRAGGLSAGDPFALYLTSGAMKGVPRIIALGTVASRVKGGPVRVAGQEFTRSCDLQVQSSRSPFELGLPFKPLVERLRFIRHKHAWSSALYRTIVELPKDDYELIQREFERSGG